MTNKSKHKHLEKMLEVYKCGIEHATRKKGTNVWWCRWYERACALRTVSGVVQEVETGLNSPFGADERQAVQEMMHEPLDPPPTVSNSTGTSSCSTVEPVEKKLMMLEKASICEGKKD
jgi:ribulose bisphosphate carboxylase small subunit